LRVTQQDFGQQAGETQPLRQQLRRHHRVATQRPAAAPVHVRELELA
jgi:hypothetical protein